MLKQRYKFILNNIQNLFAIKLAVGSDQPKGMTVLVYLCDFAIVGKIFTGCKYHRSLLTVKSNFS